MMPRWKRRARALILFLYCAEAQAGYTHYFTWRQKPDDAALHECITEMRRVIDARQGILAGPDGKGAPEVTELQCNLNGVGENAWEPFEFPGDAEFNGCKTQWQPYDEVVIACLLVARDHFPPAVLEISSDGSWEDGDWKNGAALYSSVTGRAAVNPMAWKWGGDPTRIVPSVLGAAALMVIWLVRWLRQRRGSR